MSSADFNAFGKDRYGFKAHCFALLFGPEYVPDNFDHIPYSQGRVLPPRYGPPSPQQVPWLPPGWKPNPPPFYYGIPVPPYLPKPRTFNPGLLEALERAHKERPLDIIRHDAGSNEAAALPIMVTYTSRDAVGCFKASTDAKWEVFLQELRVHMGNDQDGPLAYRQFHPLASADESDPDKLSGSYGPVRPLACAEDWEEAAIDLRRAGRELLIMEMDVFRATARKIQFLNRERDALCLPIEGLPVKTYYFDYPSIEALVDLLGGSLEIRLVGYEGRNQIGDILRKAGLECVDNFTRLSPRSLHAIEGIPIEAVRLLYLGADEMIRATHLGLEEDISSIEEIVGVY